MMGEARGSNKAYTQTRHIVKRVRAKERSTIWNLLRIIVRSGQAVFQPVKDKDKVKFRFQTWKAAL